MVTKCSLNLWYTLYNRKQKYKHIKELSIVRRNKAKTLGNKLFVLVNEKQRKLWMNFDFSGLNWCLLCMNIKKIFLPKQGRFWLKILDPPLHIIFIIWLKRLLRSKAMSLKRFLPLVNLLMKLVLPTAASPAKTTLYVRSGGPVGSYS